MASPTLVQSPEHLERAPGLLVLRLGRSRGGNGALEGLSEPGASVPGGRLHPTFLIQEASHDPAVEEGVLPGVEGGQVKPEDLHPGEHTADPAQPGVAAAVALQAPGHEPEIVGQLVGGGVAALAVLEGDAQPSAHEAQEDPVGEVPPAGRYLLQGPGEEGGVRLDPLADLGVHIHPPGGLGEKGRELEEVGAVASQGQLTVPLQGVPDRPGGDVGVAVHVAADPGGEAHG